ncbi:class I SAM-dependent methyltransferase [Caldalkalibacillus thermarum TA2.A1]|uniref:Class I SAM-dependent methyltransferase n=2 Tax=Caldalkalibacillus thermarum (strain TA2.A1) TaxID=986075 RepID=A0A8X8ICU4_CALTT|nr:class I SAM-dependent methyltransferase [Caldalkalibacillus thermarum]QZT35135.1 class I SAM-dependent methyltransferase [Caldalkalibacillus thermarum TA2.A1]
MGKWFSKLYDPVMEPLERLKFRYIRETLIHKAKGNVLEIGSGTGLNFPYYTQAVKVTAIEPDPTMRKKSLKRAEHARVPIDVILADAQALPFPEHTFDTVVGTLVLCTIPNPEKALNEIRRVCKPGGHVLFFEHVRAEHSLLGRLQDWMTPVWKRVCNGCHLNRETLETVKKAGFTIVHVEKHNNGILLMIEALNEK